MALIKKVRGKTPKIGKNVFLADNATIIGDVEIGDNSSVWFNAVIRGDVNFIKIGKSTNIQDGVIIHCTYQKYPTVIGDNVSIAHGAIIHGCTIKDNVLIGMGAIVLDDAVVEENTIIAAGAVVKEGMKLEPNSIYAGVPARKIKSIDQSDAKGEIQRIANNYNFYASWYKEDEN